MVENKDILVAATEGASAVQKKIIGSEITLTNIEIKYTIKVRRSLKNRESLLKGTTGRRRIIQFFYLSLMKNVAVS